MRNDQRTSKLLRMSAEISTVTMTTMVAADVSLRVGQVTFSQLARDLDDRREHPLVAVGDDRRAVPASDQRNQR